MAPPTARKTLPRLAWAILFAVFGSAMPGPAARPLLAQTSPQITDPAVLAQIVASAGPDVPVMLTLANRDIVELRASVLGRSSADRVHTAELLLRQIAADLGSVTVGLRPVGGASFITVADRDVFAILPADVDALAGETLDGKAQATVARLQQALDEMVEASSPPRLFRGILISSGLTLIFLGMVWVLLRVDRAARAWLEAIADCQLSTSQAAAAALVRQTRAVYFAQRAINVFSVLLLLIAAYVWIGVVLRRFPYTRPWGDSLRGFLFDQVSWLALGALHALPGLITVGLIAAVTRVVIRVSELFFSAVERGTITVRYLYPDTVAPTRKLTRAAVWMFALVIAYPFVPGSGTDAFKGVSVFVGLLISLGSTGVINQVMSGLTLTYSRALHVGDYVRVGDIEGTVTHVGTLATRVETVRREAVTIPNAVLISREVINYSKDGDATVFVPASVTIGYDAPWRQIHSLLLLAAERTAGIRREPPPVVVQEGLEDFYVRYTAWVCIEDPRQRVLTLADLYANIQDAFNEYDVQIMSPHYWADPHAPKVVPKDGWAPPPAKAAPAPGRVAEIPAHMNLLIREIRQSPLLWLLVFVPGVFVAQEMQPEAHTFLFVLSVLAIVPLATLLSHATESVAAKTGDSVGGLLNATLGNLTELVIALAALRAGEYTLVKASIAGAIVANTLFMLGASLLLGGLKHHLQEFNRGNARLQSALLFLATIALLVPSAVSQADSLSAAAFAQKLSVGLSVLLIAAYGLGLLFSLGTHRDVFGSAQHEAGDEAPWPLGSALVTLAGVTVLVALVSEVFVESVQGAALDLGMTPAFVGFIVVALVGAAAEMATAFSAARKNRLDLSVGIALGSAVQIALFVAPVLVLLSYVMGPAPMSLQFWPGAMVMMFLATMTAAQVTSSGRSAWFVGVLLLMVYVIFAMTLYLLPPASG